MPEQPEIHADNWDLRHEDFNDVDFLYDVYAVMRQKSPFAHTDTPFLSATPGGAWVAVRYEECYKILQDWENFSSNPTPEGAEQLAGDLVITLDPPRQQKFRKVLNPYFSPARMKALRPQIRDETDLLIDTFIETGGGDLAQVAWRQPGIVFFKYVLGMPIGDVPVCLDLTDKALNGETEQDRMTAWGGLYQHLHDAVTARVGQPARDDMIDVLLNAEIDGESCRSGMLWPTPCCSCRQVWRRPRAQCRSRSTIWQRIPANEIGASASRRSCRELSRSSFVSGDRSWHPPTVTQEVELSGRTFCPGESVLVNYASANRDPAEFVDPDQCILDRQANRHLGFGAGVHRCLGSNLARLEFQVGIEQVLSRLPDYVLSPEEETEFHGNSVTRGYRSIPVMFTAGARSVSAEL